MLNYSLIENFNEQCVIPKEGKKTDCKQDDIEDNNFKFVFLKDLANNIKDKTKTFLDKHLVNNQNNKTIFEKLYCENFNKQIDETCEGSKFLTPNLDLKFKFFFILDKTREDRDVLNVLNEQIDNENLKKFIQKGQQTFIKNVKLFDETDNDEEIDIETFLDNFLQELDNLIELEEQEPTKTSKLTETTETSKPAQIIDTTDTVENNSKNKLDYKIIIAIVVGVIALIIIIFFSIKYIKNKNKKTKKNSLKKNSLS